jgi:hypothetical protein
MSQSGPAYDMVSVYDFLFTHSMLIYIQRNILLTVLVYFYNDIILLLKSHELLVLKGWWDIISPD